MKHTLRYWALGLLVLCFGLQGSWAQKLVIGSEIPSLKGVVWQSVAPRLEQQPIFIEFYHHNNSSSRKFIEKLSQIEQRGGDGIQIVILTRDADGTLPFLVEQYGDRYIIGHDPTGVVFRNFGVKYIPYSLLIDRKKEVVWIGNLGNFDVDIIGEVL